MSKEIGYIPFEGGYDSKTPVLHVKPGRLRASKNWYQDVNGGYISFSGYERYSGQFSPSSGQFGILNVTLTESVSVGDTVSDGVYTAVVLAVVSGYLVVTRWTGFFTAGTITVLSVPVGTCTGPQSLTYSSDLKLAAQYRNLAADSYRDDISTAGGANCSGPVLGIVSLDDIDYAFRNNAAGTAAVMYKSSLSGWVACDLGYTLDFELGSAAFVEGETVSYPASFNSATIKKVVLTSGSWVNDELTTNGEFATDTSWTKGTGWTIASGKATHSLHTYDLEQSIIAFEGSTYLVTYKLSGITRGIVTPYLGGTAGTTRSANGVYSEQIVAGSTEILAFTPSSDFIGHIEYVTVRILDATGYLVISEVTGPSFSAGGVIVSSSGSATAVAAESAIELTANAEYEFVVTNFTGSADTTKIYGCNGVDRGFEWDGETFVPIRTGMTVDAPEHIYAHHMQLFFSFFGSVQHSSPGEPYNWSVITGASEIAMGDTVTAFKGQPGADGTPALAILTKNTSAMLYGSGVSDWQLIPFKDGVGARARSVQRLGRVFILDDSGIITLSQSQAYGNFDDATVSQHIHDWIIAKRDILTCSCISRDLNLYMLFFEDYTALFVTVHQGKAVAMMPMQFSHKVLCVWSYERTDGSERILFGDENGYVHQMFKGTSFDGDDIETYLKLSYVHFNSPTTRKRWRSVTFDVQITDYFEYTFSYLLEYKSTKFNQSANQTETITLSSDNWDSGDSWDSGENWDNLNVLPVFVRLHGIGTSIGFSTYSKSDYFKSVRFSSGLVKYTPAKELP